MGDGREREVTRSNVRTRAAHPVQPLRGKPMKPAPTFDFSKVTVQPTGADDPRVDPNYIDNLDEYTVSQMLLWADRYTISWKGGKVTIVNADIEPKKTDRFLEMTNVAATRADAIKNAESWNDVATQGGYTRAYSFYKVGSVIVPTVFSPETVPRVWATMMGVHRGTAETAAAAYDFFKGQRNALIVGFILGGVLRVVPRIFGGGGGGGGGLPDIPLPEAPVPDPVGEDPVAPQPKPESVKSDPVKTDPVKTDPVKTDPAKTEAAPKMTIRQRLDEFFRRLRGLPRATTPREALAQIRDTLDAVEDDLSGVAKKNPPPPPKEFDGRMYPPLEDSVKVNEDGSMTARTRGHRIELGKDGSITIKNVKTGDVEFQKP